MQQQQFMPFGWPLPAYLPLPPTIEDNDLFINSVITGQPGIPGPQGVGIKSAEVTDNPGDLLLTLTDGTVINAGNVVGPQGPQGPQGTSGSTRNVITITCDYIANSSDYYIGANLSDAAKVTLPFDVEYGTEYVIKLEYGAPIGNRKLTIKPEAPALINGLNNMTLNTPYQCVSVIFNNDNWWTT